jgi:hypothetical protein
LYYKLHGSLDARRDNGPEDAPSVSPGVSRCLTTTMRKPLRRPGHYHRPSQPPLFNPFQLDRRARSRCQLSYRAGWQWATQRWISTALNAPLTNEPYSKISGNFKPIYTNPNLPARFLIRRTASRLCEGVVCSLHNSNSFDLPVLQQLGVCSHPSTKPPSRPRSTPTSLSHASMTPIPA